MSVCRMFNQIVAGKSPPRHLSSDHDSLFRFHRWLANLRILEVDEIESIPYVPVGLRSCEAGQTINPASRPTLRRRHRAVAPKQANVLSVAGECLSAVQRTRAYRR
jgi:hypothetical protein